jgi:hypothetical protein
VSKMRWGDLLSWVGIILVVLVAQWITTNDDWGHDVVLAVLIAAFAVGLSVLARNRRPGR